MEDPTDTSVLIVRRHFLDLHRYVFISTLILESALLFAMLLIVVVDSVCKVICDDIFEYIEWAAKPSDIVVEPLIQRTPDPRKWLFSPLFLSFSVFLLVLSSCH